MHYIRVYSHASGRTNGYTGPFDTEDDAQRYLDDEVRLSGSEEAEIVTEAIGEIEEPSEDPLAWLTAEMNEEIDEGRVTGIARQQREAGMWP